MGVSQTGMTHGIAPDGLGVSESFVLDSSSREHGVSQICMRVPSSTTALSGSRKNSTTLPALRFMVA